MGDEITVNSVRHEDEVYKVQNPIADKERKKKRCQNRRLDIHKNYLSTIRIQSDCGSMSQALAHKGGNHRYTPSV